MVKLEHFVDLVALTYKYVVFKLKKFSSIVDHLIIYLNLLLINLIILY